MFLFQVKLNWISFFSCNIDPQEGLEEDELLAEVAEDGDDDAMEGPTDAVPLQVNSFFFQFATL